MNKLETIALLAAIAAVVIFGVILSHQPHHCIATVVYASGVDDCGSEHPWH